MRADFSGSLNPAHTQRHSHFECVFRGPKGPLALWRSGGRPTTPQGGGTAVQIQQSTRPNPDLARRPSTHPLIDCPFGFSQKRDENVNTSVCSDIRLSQMSVNINFNLPVIICSSVPQKLRNHLPLALSKQRSV